MARIRKEIVTGRHDISYNVDLKDKMIELAFQKLFLTPRCIEAKMNVLDNT